MRVIAPLILLGTLSAGHAQEPEPTKLFYAGVSLGAMEYEEDITIIDPGLASFNDSTTAWKIYGGYNFNEHFGVEGGYMRSNDSVGTVSGTDSIDGDYVLSARADFRGYSIKAMGYLPMSWGQLFAGIGLYENRSDLRFAAAFDCCAEEILTSSDGFSGLTGQIGMQWNLQSFVLRADYEWWNFYDVGGGAEVLNLGAQWQF